MKVSIRDREALSAVSPVALAAYARGAGWIKGEPYGDHSDVYDAEGLPEIILPRTQRLGDYAHVVSQLIEIFARVAEVDELALYRDLVTADRDVIRVRAGGNEGAKGDVPIDAGIDLMCGARDMLVAAACAACSLENPRPLYRTNTIKKARDNLSRMRLGQTEQGSFVVTLLTPVIPPHCDIEPIERRITKRLSDALSAIQKATKILLSGNIFSEYTTLSAIQKVTKRTNGVSANLCEALVTLIEPFPTLDISVVWARTRPLETGRETIRFAKDDAPILREVARSFRQETDWETLSRHLQNAVDAMLMEEARGENSATLPLRDLLRETGEAP